MVLTRWSHSGAALWSCHGCALLKVDTSPDMIFDVARTKNPTTKNVALLESHNWWHMLKLQSNESIPLSKPKSILTFDTTYPYTIKQLLLNIRNIRSIDFCCLLLFYVLATSKVISVWGPTCDSALSWRLYSASLGHQAVRHHDLLSHSVKLSWHWANQSLPYPNTA